MKTMQYFTNESEKHGLDDAAECYAHMDADLFAEMSTHFETREIVLKEAIATLIHIALKEAKFDGVRCFGIGQEVDKCRCGGFTFLVWFPQELAEIVSRVADQPIYVGLLNNAVHLN